MFPYNLVVRQGESLSPFLFSIYLNDIEETYILKVFEGVDTGMFKLYLLLYADDIVLMSQTETGLQKGLYFTERLLLTMETLCNC
mgnify:CR=1 FL=1